MALIVVLIVGLIAWNLDVRSNLFRVVWLVAFLLSVVLLVIQ